MTRPAFLIALTMLACSGCGVVGAPVAPETVGVAPIIERQKQREAAVRAGEIPPSPAQTMGTASGAGGAVEPAEELPVPPAQSVGTGMGTR